MPHHIEPDGAVQLKTLWAVCFRHNTTKRIIAVCNSPDPAYGYADRCTTSHKQHYLPGVFTVEELSIWARTVTQQDFNSTPDYEPIIMDKEAKTAIGNLLLNE